MRIAIVGAGISGRVAAHLVHGEQAPASRASSPRTCSTGSTT